jgi:hypothetical protein
MLLLDQTNCHMQKSLKNDQKKKDMKQPEKGQKKKLTISLVCRHPKLDFYFWTRMYGHFKKPRKKSWKLVPKSY